MSTEQERIAQLSRRTRRPLTPGQVIAGLLKENQISQVEFAECIGVARATVNRLIQGHCALTPDMAHRLGRFFGNGPAVWLQMQATVDLWDALHLDTSVYEAIKTYKAKVA